MEAWLTALIGVAILCFALREIYRDLFQPTGSGSLSSGIGRALFSIARRQRWLLPSSGPLSILLTVTCWTAMLAVGFALVYGCGFPAGFTDSVQGNAAGLRKFGTMLYFSLGAMTTLGSGELMARAEWIRLLAALESLIGFSLVTASISWLVLIFPALRRMRTLARHVATLISAEQNTGVPVISDESESLLFDLGLAVIQARVDLVHHPLTYYFHANTSPLPESLRAATRFAEAGAREDRPERVRLAAGMLSCALEDLARVIAHRFVDADETDTKAVFRAFAVDHLAEG